MFLPVNVLTKISIPHEGGERDGGWIRLIRESEAIFYSQKTWLGAGSFTGSKEVTALLEVEVVEAVQKVDVDVF